MYYMSLKCIKYYVILCQKFTIVLKIQLFHYFAHFETKNRNFMNFSLPARVACRFDIFCEQFFALICDNYTGI